MNRHLLWFICLPLLLPGNARAETSTVTVEIQIQTNDGKTVRLSDTPIKVVDEDGLTTALALDCHVTSPKTFFNALHEIHGFAEIRTDVDGRAFIKNLATNDFIVAQNTNHVASTGEWHFWVASPTEIRDGKLLLDQQNAGLRHLDELLTQDQHLRNNLIGKLQDGARAAIKQKDSKLAMRLASEAAFLGIDPESKKLLSESMGLAMAPKLKKIMDLGVWSGSQSNLAQAKEPWYVDCFPDKAVIYPGSITNTWEALQQPDNPLAKLLDDIQAHPKDQYLVVMARPGSEKFFRLVRKMASQRPIDVGYDLTDASFKVDWDEAPKALTSTNLEAQAPQPAPQAVVREMSNPLASDDSSHDVFKPAPRAVPSDKQAAFFECRNSEVFYIDKAGLDAQVVQALGALPSDAKQSDPTQGFKSILNKDIGNEYYKVIPSYLLTMIMALEPRTPPVHGTNSDQLFKADSNFQRVLSHLDAKTRYLVFMVRDDSFGIFRQARSIAGQFGFDISFELLGADEPIKLGTGGQQVISR